MLEIIFKSFGGNSAHLDIDVNDSLQVEATLPAFDSNISDGTYSLPIDAPWSDINRNNLGAPEMLESLLVEGDVYWECEVRSNGIVVLPHAKMTLIKVSGDFNYKSGTYTLVITGAESIFGHKIKKLKLSQLELGGQINYDMDSRTFAYKVMQGGFPNVRNILAFAPVLNTEFFDKSRSDYHDEFLDGNVMNRVWYPTDGSDWTFDCASEADPAVKAAAGVDGYANFRTVPFFSFLHILKKVFNSLGYVAEGDIFEDKFLKKIYLYNNFSLEVYQYNNVDINRVIYPRNHMPDITVAEFLEAASQIFNFKIDFTGLYKTSLISKRAPDNLLDITPYVVNYFTSENVHDNNDGMRVQYAFPSDDGAASDRIVDIDAAILRGTFDTYDSIDYLAFTPSLAEGDLIFVRDVNYYFKFSGETGTFLYYAEGFLPAVIGAGDDNVQLIGSPLLQAVGNDENGDIYNLNMVECRMPGSYVNRYHVRVRNPVPFRFFFIEEIKVVEYPTPLPISSNKIAGLSLSMGGINGIYANYWERWQTRLRTGKKVTAMVHLPPQYSYAELSNATLRILNHQFLLMKMRYSIGDNNPDELELLLL